MDYDYSKRGILPPDGCEDLSDASKQADTEAVATQIIRTKHNFIVTARLPELNDQELEIVVDGRYLRIVAQPDGAAPFESAIKVPAGYQIDAARAVYVMGNLRIVIPRKLYNQRRQVK